jgi:uncharacterized protein with HEPN domain
MSESDRDQLHLRIIADAIADLQRRLAVTDLEPFLKDRDEQALAAFRLLIIGENANKLSDQLKARHPELSWRRMVAFRNIVAHEYHRADPALVWEAALALGELEIMVESELVGSTNKGE